MAKDEFVWDDSALQPATVDIGYPTKDGTDKVTHYELSRTDLVEFIAAALDTDFMREVEKDGQTIQERIPFAEVSKGQLDLFFKYMAKSTRGAKKPEFFEKLEIGARGMEALVTMFMKLNHVAEVISTAGNWFMLPSVREAMNSPEEETSSEHQKPTLDV